MNISDSFTCQFTLHSLFKTGFLISPLVNYSLSHSPSKRIYTHNFLLIPYQLIPFLKGKYLWFNLRWSLSLNLEAAKLWTNSVRDFPFLKTFVGGMHA